MVRYGKFAAMSAAFLLGAVCLVGTAQEPKKGPGDGEGKKIEGKGFPKGGFQGGGRFGGGGLGQVLPSFLHERLKLNDEQKKQVADLQKDVEAKLAKVLNEEQNKQLKEMRDRGPGGFGGPGGGFGRPGGGFGKGEPKKKDD